MLPAGMSPTARSSGVVLEDHIAVPIDVGKRSAMAKVIDFTGATLVKPFTFDLDRRGVGMLVERVGKVLPDTVALVRVGLEAAGHYHLPLAGGILPPDWELHVFNPGHVAAQRRVNGKRGVKSDQVDLTAIADLVLLGRGRPAPVYAEAIQDLSGWVAHRRRRSLVRRQTIQQLTTHVDRCFPGLSGAVWSVALSMAGRLICTELPDPARVVRLGPARLRAFAARRGVRMTSPIAERIVEAARQSLPVPGAAVARQLLASDLSFLARIEAEIEQADGAIASLLASTPYEVLLSVPGWGPVRVAAYGAAVGDPERWHSAQALYRAAGLTPRLYQSSGTARHGHITREGSAVLRSALVDLGLGLWHKEPTAQAYGQALRARGKPGGVIVTAMANRANRIAFAMVRDKRCWEASRWAA
jgi:transposase